MKVPPIFKYSAVLGWVALAVSCPGAAAAVAAPLLGGRIVRRGACGERSLLVPEPSTFTLDSETDLGRSALLPLEGEKVFSARWVKPTTTDEIVRQASNRDGSLAINISQLNIPAEGTVQFVSAARFGDGKIAVCWTESNAGVKCAILSSDGSTVLQRVTTSFTETTRQFDVGALSNGNVMVSQNLIENMVAEEIDSSGQVVPDSDVFLMETGFDSSQTSSITFEEFPSGQRAWGVMKVFLSRRKLISDEGETYVHITNGGTELVGSPFYLTTSTIKSKPGTDHKSAMSISGMVVAWEGDDDVVRLSRVDNAGIVTTLDIEAGSMVDVTSDGVDKAFLTYQKTGDLYIQTIDISTMTPLSCLEFIGTGSSPAGVYMTDGTLRIEWQNGGIKGRNIVINNPPTNPIVLDRLASLGESVDFDLGSAIVDPDGHAVTLSVVEDGQATLPSGCSYNSTSKILTCTFSTVGPVTFRITADDGYLGSPVDFTFTVNVAHSPTQANSASQTVNTPPMTYSSAQTKTQSLPQTRSLAPTRSPAPTATVGISATPGSPMVWSSSFPSNVVVLTGRSRDYIIKASHLGLQSLSGVTFRLENYSDANAQSSLGLYTSGEEPFLRVAPPYDLLTFSGSVDLVASRQGVDASYRFSFTGTTSADARPYLTTDVEDQIAIVGKNYKQFISKSLYESPYGHPVTTRVKFHNEENPWAAITEVEDGFEIRGVAGEEPLTVEVSGLDSELAIEGEKEFSIIPKVKTGGGGSDDGAIAGGVVGAIAGVSAIAGAVFYFRKKKQEADTELV